MTDSLSYLESKLADLQEYKQLLAEKHSLQCEGLQPLLRISPMPPIIADILKVNLDLIEQIKHSQRLNEIAISEIEDQIAQKTRDQASSS